MLAPPPAPTPASLYAAKVRSIRRELREEYLQPHDHPWIIGFSGGKDSTLLLHFVLEAIRNIAPDERRRPIFVVSNDTLVESPVFQAFVDRLLARLEESLAGLNVPLRIVRTHLVRSGLSQISALSAFLFSCGAVRPGCEFKHRPGAGKDLAAGRHRHSQARTAAPYHLRKRSSAQCSVFASPAVNQLQSLLYAA